MTINNINIVYGVGAAPYIEVSFNDGSNIDVLQEQIGLDELAAYIARFEQQAFLNDEVLNFGKSLFTINEIQYNSISVTSNANGTTPPPGAVTKNFVLMNGSNIGTVELKAIDFGSAPNNPEFVTGDGYENDLSNPIVGGEAVRGNILTPQASTVTITLDVSGLSSTTDLGIFAFGENAVYEHNPLDNGTDQDFTIDISMVYGGTLFILVIAGAQPSNTPPAPPARSGVLVVQTNRPYYKITGIDQVKLPNTGIIYPVSNNMQFGTWNLNSTTSIDVDVENNSVIPSAAVAYCQVNGVTVDSQVVPKGISTITFNNVPSPIPTNQSVRISFFGA